MFSLESIKDGLYDFIFGQTAFETIRADQNVTKPDSPHLTFKVGSLIRAGDDYFTPPDTNGFATLIGHREYVCEVNGYGDGVIQKLEDLRVSLIRPDVVDSLKANKIVIYNEGPVQNITGLDESEFEERGLLELFCRSQLSVDNVDIGVIKIVNGEATYKQPGKPDIVQNLTADSTT